MDDEGNPPCGILFLLGTEEQKPELDNFQFEKMVAELYLEGACVLPPNKWIN